MRGLLSVCHLLTLYSFLFIPLACVCVFVLVASHSSPFPIEGNSYCKPAFLQELKLLLPSPSLREQKTIDGVKLSELTLAGGLLS